MRPVSKMISRILIVIFMTTAAISYAEQKGTPIYGRIDPSKYIVYEHVHEGAGSMSFMRLLGSDTFESNIFNIHRGIIPPKCGIGEHLHRNSEDMYFVFNAPAEFTVNGRTALLPAGSCVLCPLGSSHGIYNNSDEPLEWMNISVSVEKGNGKTINYKEDLANQKVESPAPFKWAQFDRSLMKPMVQPHLGKGAILNNKPWLDYNFSTNWFRIGHCLLPPDTSIGYHQHNATEEVYYVMSGTGRITVNDHTWVVRKGDAIPCTLHDSHGLYNHTDEDLEILVLIVRMDTSKLEGHYNKLLKDEYRALEVINWGDDLSGR